MEIGQLILLICILIKPDRHYVCSCLDFLVSSLLQVLYVVPGTCCVASHTCDNTVPLASLNTGQRGTIIDPQGSLSTISNNKTITGLKVVKKVVHINWAIRETIW